MGTNITSALRITIYLQRKSLRPWKINLTIIHSAFNNSEINIKYSLLASKEQHNLVKILRDASKKDRIE